jgi:hypothetical protein
MNAADQTENRIYDSEMESRLRAGQGKNETTNTLPSPCRSLEQLQHGQASPVAVTPSCVDSDITLSSNRRLSVVVVRTMATDK